MDPLRSKRLVYTSFNADQHDELMWAMHNDPVSWTNACAQIQRPMDRTFHDSILRQKGRQLLFVIINTVASDCDKQPKSGQELASKLNPIGQLVLAASDSTTAQHCETTLSIGIHKDYQRQGYGTEAINWALDWAFSYANMHRVGLTVYGWNIAAVEMYKKVGFREEGRKRESRFLRGKYWDEILMSVLVQEWRELRGMQDDKV